MTWGIDMMIKHDLQADPFHSTFHLIVDAPTNVTLVESPTFLSATDLPVFLGRISGSDHCLNDLFQALSGLIQRAGRALRVEPGIPCCAPCIPVPLRR
jgi:hypothetical protein